MITREPGQLALAFLLGHPLELTLACVDGFLAFGEVADPIGGLLFVLRLLGPFLHLRALLVVGSLLALQLLVEECRQVLTLAVAATAAAVAVLLLGNLTPADFSLGLHQAVECGHLVTDRIASSVGRELLDRLRHRRHGGRDRTLTRGRLRRTNDLLRQERVSRYGEPARAPVPPAS